mgnify:CR=1 FL=1
MSKKTQKQQYVKKDPIDHCLSRSDMYVGSKRFRKSLTNPRWKLGSEVGCTPQLHSFGARDGRGLSTDLWLRDRR